ncbi:pilus (MSHA type) biogenesis protein MshL [Agaribacter flavus]|uniref:Pilus (MSHA type) biogenesis protein MshL n=1 Tax=Agaribacter flavus TaxID=1902781 RepID=A0ABV7FRR3_9ALTE
MSGRFRIFSASTVATTLCLSACVSTDESHVIDALEQDLRQIEAQHSASQPLQTIPDAVANTLLPTGLHVSNTLIEEEKYDINANAVEAVSFFSGLVADTPFSVALHPEVQGLITLSLKQVSLTDVFSILTDLYGYHIEKVGSVYRVFPAGLRTETFAVNYLMMQRNGQTQTSIISGGVTQSGNGNGAQQNNRFQQNGNTSRESLGGSGNFSGTSGVTNGTTISTSSELNFWENLQSSLSTMLGDGEGKSVLVSPQAGLVTVRALPDEINTIERFLSVSEQNLTRQVIIEARILEVVLNDEYQQGINWQQVAGNIGSTDLQFSSAATALTNGISASLGGVTSLSFINQDFVGVLDLLQTQGNVQVLSSPRVTAINNQKAVIKVGDDEYFVTEVSSQNTITATSTSVIPNIELTPFFSGIALDVTPQIDKSGSILLHIHPSVIETEEQEKVVTLNEERIVLPLAQSTIRESDTIIRAQSGEIVVIGGLMQSITSQEETKTPLLGDIPVLGNLFKNKREKEVKKELVILLKPTVVENGTWKRELERSRTQMKNWLYVE